MQTLISNSVTLQLAFHHSPQNFAFHFPSLFVHRSHFLKFSVCKHLAPTKSSASHSSAFPNYGGWDDFGLGGDSVLSGESTHLLCTFLNSIGLDDKKYVFVYLFGFVCALAIYRVRVSSIVAVPVCVLVFAAGFSIGVSNGGRVSELSLGQRRTVDENSKVLIERLQNLADLFNGFDVKMESLTNGLRRNVKSNQITKSDLESYSKTVELMGASTLHGKTVLEGCMESILVKQHEVQRKPSQKSSNRRTEFDLLQFIAEFQESAVGPKPNKFKDDVKKDRIKMQASDDSEMNILHFGGEDKEKNAMFYGNKNYGNPGPAGFVSENNRRIQGASEEKLINHVGKINTNETKTSVSSNLYEENRALHGKNFSSMENGMFSFNVGQQNSIRQWASRDGSLDFDFSVSLKQMRSEASLQQEQNYMKIKGNHVSPDSFEESEKEAYESHFKEELVESSPSLLSVCQEESDSSPSSVVSDDMMFNKYLMEANSLLDEARENLKHTGNGGDAENALSKSARLLSNAISMKPLSLLAVGQLGNTYLLHGELKLRISRELRAILERSDPFSVESVKDLKGIDDRVNSKENLAHFLVNICEECEELLVEAGRKYRLALSIDGNDTRALYNWGLALSFRAQLISDIGPEAAFDADKLYLAAIDKFDAMMSKSNVYTPDALFRWGMALQQRSRLRTRNRKEKLKLLSQAKRLYEDALLMDSGHPKVRGALSSCISELNNR